MPPRKPIRKPNHRVHGVTVTICGKVVGNSDSICLLPVRHEGFAHATLGIGDINKEEGTSLAIIAALFDPNVDEEVEMWQLRELVPPVPNE